MLGGTPPPTWSWPETNTRTITSVRTGVYHSGTFVWIEPLAAL